MSHPLTDKMCSEIDDSIDSEYGTPTFSECIRKGYDIGVKAGREEQLKKDLEWLDEYGQDYFDHYSHELHMLLGDLVRAMRPAAQGEES